MIPSAWELYPEGTLHFQQDNHPVHTANRIQEWFHRRPNIDLLKWPPNSPEWIKSIENVWAGVKGILRSNWAEQSVGTSDELCKRVLNMWQEVATDVDLFHNLVDSMPRRMRAIVNAGGLWTKYESLPQIFFFKYFFAYVLFINIWYLRTFRGSK